MNRCGNRERWEWREFLFLCCKVHMTRYFSWYLSMITIPTSRLDKSLWIHKLTKLENWTVLCYEPFTRIRISKCCPSIKQGRSNCNHTLGVRLIEFPKSDRKSFIVTLHDTTSWILKFKSLYYLGLFLSANFLFVPFWFCLLPFLQVANGWVGVGLRSILVTNKRINLCCIVVLRESYTYFLVNKPYYFFAMILAFREKKKREERAETQKANEAVTKCLGVYQYAGQ